MAGLDDDPTGDTTDRRSRAGLVVAAILGAGLTLFVVQNTRSTRVEWLVFEFRQPLWLVLLVTAAVTLVVAELLGAARRRRKRRSS